MVDSLIDAARQLFLDVAADIHGSLVYLDAGAAEVAELTLGPAFLLGRCMAAADGVCYAWFAVAASISLYDVCMLFYAYRNRLRCSQCVFAGASKPR
jgi:hypothetical protein